MSSLASVGSVGSSSGDAWSSTFIAPRNASSFNVGAAGHVYSDGVVDGGVGPLTPSLMVKVKAAGTITVAAGGVVEASNMLLEGGSLTVNGNIKADGLGYQPGKITCGMLR